MYTTSTPKEVGAYQKHLWDCRWAARTDILWLCHNVLSYTKIDPIIHTPVINHLQKFPRPTIEQARACDQIMSDGTFRYTPWHDPYTILLGPRRRLILDSRSYFKTTLNTIAHSIQWLLNYPHIAIMLLFSTSAKAEDIIKGIEEHFRHNARLRELFPDFCPRTRIADWGTAAGFTLPNRNSVLERMKLPPRVEESVMSQSLDKGQSGYHFDLIKCSDVIEQNNVATPQQRYQAKFKFGLLPKLLVKRPDGMDGWIDCEGTFYHPDDLHSDLVSQWLAEPDPIKRRWSIFVRGVFKRDTKGAPPRYDPHEIRLPFLLDTKGKRVPTWPEADPIEKLEAEEADPQEGLNFANQRILDPYATLSSNRPFSQGPVWKQRGDFAHVPIEYRIATVDLADTQGVESNPSVITVCAYDRIGRCYVDDIQRGRWTAEETLDRVFSTWDRYEPLGMRQIVIEEYAYVRGLKVSIERMKVLRTARKGTQDTINLGFIKRKHGSEDSKKVTRIVHALQPPFNSGELMFVNPLSADPVVAREVREALENELRDCTIFSTGKYDDILDTLADQFLYREYFGVERGKSTLLLTDAEIRERETREYNAAWRKLLYVDDAKTLAFGDSSGY